jgi:hypothetical protein
MRHMGQNVECYSGSEYAEYPIAFEYQGERLQVTEILRRQRSPTGKSFRVRPAHSLIFELHYDEAGDVWLIEPENARQPG